MEYELWLNNSQRFCRIRAYVLLPYVNVSGRASENGSEWGHVVLPVSFDHSNVEFKHKFAEALPLCAISNRCNVPSIYQLGVRSESEMSKEVIHFQLYTLNCVCLR